MWERVARASGSTIVSITIAITITICTIIGIDTIAIIVIIINTSVIINIVSSPTSPSVPSSLFDAPPP